MAALPLTPEQQRDAKRLSDAFELWKSARAERGLPTSQDAVAELFGMGQSGLNQYLKGKIPLNAKALIRFCSVMQVHAANISPGIVQQQRELMEQLEQPVPAMSEVAETAQDVPRKRAGG